MVSDKEIILRFPIVSLWEMMTPGLGPFRPKGHDLNDLCWVPLIIATHKILKLLTSWFQRRRFCFTFSYCKSTGDDDPRGVDNLDPRSMIVRIYVGYH